MREIKFRAWYYDLFEDDKGEMIPWVNLHLETDEDGLFMWKGDGNDNFGSGESTNDYELMQYTGLKDKNGKEMYEGDIVEATYCVDGCYDATEDEYGVIQWDDKQCGFNIIFKDELLPSPMSYYVSFEVLGNIYENPELLQV